MKKESGITLIALVISIIVLIILAGVAINTLMNNGIIDKAKTAKEQYQNAQEYEETQIAKYSNELESHVDGNRDTVTIPKEEYDNIKNNVLIYETLYEGNANTKNTFILNRSITDYEYLIVYGKAGNNGRRNSMCIDSSDYEIGTNDNIFTLGTFCSSDYFWYIHFAFSDSTTLKVRDTQNSNWGNPSIYLIKGVRKIFDN